ncbi:MAG: alpha/beta fold hydrolase [Chitinophagaceae bacterium]
MQIFKNLAVPGLDEIPMATDVLLKMNGIPKPVLIYAHGFNGFKDWGNFDLLATQAAEIGFAFVKFNFSHNGTNMEHPQEFVNLEAYAENNYTTELFDLGKIVDWVENNERFKAEFDTSRIGLIGHSLGGGIAILYAAEDARIKALTTWAAIAQCQTPWATWPESRIEKWKETGVDYILNSRTNQEMPLHYRLYENFQKNQQRLDIFAAISALEIPVLICHGTNDASVPFVSAEALLHAQPNAALFAVQSDHVFGRKHPWTEAEPPLPMQQVMDETLRFFKRKL